MTAPDNKPHGGSDPAPATGVLRRVALAALRWGSIMGAVVIVGAALLLVAAVAWWVTDVQRVWGRLDEAAEQFEPPPGFTELDRVRGGTAFCVVSCTNGGEAVVTIVMSVDDPADQDACVRLGRALAGVSSEPGEQIPLDDYECFWTGALGGDATASAVIIQRSNMKTYGPARLYPWRWTDERDVPAEGGPLLAWVEFTSGIE